MLNSVNHISIKHRIACLDLDAFFVEAALKEHPELRGRPVAVGGTGSRSVICSASYEARKYGVKSAMPVWQAMNRCPQLIIIPVPENISILSKQVFSRLQLFCPVVEQASVDEFYLDFTGCDRIYPTNFAIGDLIIRELQKDPGLPSTIGFGSNKLICKIASNLGKPAGMLEIIPGNEMLFLAHLPVNEIPGIGRKMQPLLNEMAVYNISDILQLPLEAWKSAFGRTGEYIFRAAQGISDEAVIPEENKPQRKGISRDTTLSEDTASRSILSRHLSYLVEKAVYQLQSDSLTCGNVTVKLRYADFVTTTRTARINRTNDDREIFQTALRLMINLFQRRLKIRLIGVHLGSLQPGTTTPDLFESLQSEHRRHLPEILRLIRARYGFKAILRSRSAISKTGGASNEGI